MAQAEAPARENLFTKKAEKVFFQQARDEAEAAGKVAVLLKGFDNHEKNMILDDGAMKIKNANKEHTIIVCSVFCCRSATRCAARGKSARSRRALSAHSAFSFSLAPPTHGLAQHCCRSRSML